MEDTKALNDKYNVIGWSALFIWWGIVVLVDPLTIGMGAIGTGLIFLGVNAGRSLEGLKDFPTRRSNNMIGITALAWGLLDVARQALGWDWGASFALFLIVVGIILFGSLLMPLNKSYT